MYNKRTFVTLLIAFVIIGLLTGCYIQAEQEENFGNLTTQAYSTDDQSTQTDEINPWELFHSVGEKIRELDAILEIDDPAFFINGHPISRREIEISRIWNDISPNASSLRESIDSIIRDNVLLQEAQRQNLQPSLERISNYIEPLRLFVEEGNEWILAQIEGMGLTEEAFFAEQEKLAYNMFLREALWLPIYVEQKNEIEAEANRRNVNYDIVVQEFYAKFADDLVRQANIEILDPAIRELF